MAKTIIITGASRGIGLAIARYLLHDGNNVVILARSRAPLEELKDQYPKQVRVLTGDMADFSIAKRAAGLATSEFGQIDGLVINHGQLSPVTRIADSNVEEWKISFDIGFFSAIELSKQSMPALRKSKGCIIVTSSGASVHAYSTWGAYGASKAALNSLCRTIAVEEPDVTALSVAPGVVDTDMQKEVRDVHSSLMDEKDAKKFLNLLEDGGLLKPEQPGNVMARLVLNPPKELSGEFLSWNNEKLKHYQDK